MDTKGGGGMDWEIGIDVCTLLCMKWVAGEGLLYGTGKEKKEDTICLQDIYKVNLKNAFQYTLCANTV